MATYHFVPETGKVGTCKARSISLCAFGSIDSHFTSFEAAEAAYKEFMRLKRDALDVKLLCHGDRIHLRSPEGHLLDAVIHDTGYDLLIITAGSNAPTNGVKSLIEYGWKLEKRIGAFGEFAINPATAQEEAHQDYKKLSKELSVIAYKAGELRELLRNEPGNSSLEAEFKLYEAKAAKLRFEQEDARLKYANAVLVAAQDRKEPGFSGLHDVPFGFTGKNDYIGIPTYSCDASGSIIQELDGVYTYSSKDFAEEPKEFQNFGEAILWARDEALKNEN